MKLLTTEELKHSPDHAVQCTHLTGLITACSTLNPLLLITPYCTMPTAAAIDAHRRLLTFVCGS
jgi:hypothetical protein